MGLFSKAKKVSGWLAISFQGEGVCAASVKRGVAGKPTVALLVYYHSDKPCSPEVLAKLGKELHANGYHCSSLLAGGEYQLLTVEAPAVPLEERKTAVRWRLKDMLDFPADQATIDLLDIPMPNTAQGRGGSLFAIAARNSVIEARQNLFVAGAVKLAVIDIPEMAQRNISAMIEPEGRGVAMLSFNADGGLLTVTFKGELYLSRRMDVTLAQLLDTDPDRKHEHFDKITLELQRSLDHFDRQYSFISVSKLVLAPTGTSGLDEYLSSNLYTPVQTMNLADVLDISAHPELADAATQQRFFLTLGAALRDEGSAA